jgi:hypothetical protein
MTCHDDDNCKQKVMGGRGALLGGLLGMLAASGLTAAAAQSPSVLVSLSVDDTLPLGAVRDQDLVFHAPGAMAHVAWPSETLALFAGDQNGSNALHTVFGDVDAIATRPGGPTAAASLLISLASDEAGFKDGDVLAIGPAGFEVFIPEADFVAATGATDGNVDLDALQYDGDGMILFSFADNETSSVLSGDTPGLIKDGDIIQWVPAGGPPTMLYNETQVNGLVSHALSVSTTAGDTMSLARDHATGEILFSVQSPTANDATVFSTINGGTVVAGQAESNFGFTGSPELDALDVPLWTFPALTVDAPTPPPGASIKFSIAGAQPDKPYVLLASLSMPSTPSLALPGWGAAVLANDAVLAATLYSTPSLLMVPDALGNASLTASVPAVFPPTDFVVQVLKPAPAPECSNPLVLEVAQ